MTIKEFVYSRVAAFGHAFRGWGHALKTQHNAWIHSVVATIVVILGLWLGLPPRDWAVLVLAIAMVFTAEFINTSIEAVVDLASPVHHPLAKIGKDVGAAAVLVAALSAILIGLLILGPPLWQKVGAWFGQSPQRSRAEQTAFKGMELYAWQNKSGGWQYAILEGTNHNKTLAEVQEAPLDLQGVKMAIGQMAVGEALFWMNNAYDSSVNQTLSLPLPPKAIMDDIMGFARENQVDLHIP
ncbi:MAG TPA: diacylglycerol kinase family protein [Anaerolineales bacterium]|nr:diacylglycerol kinase family protein [Anaerolineales bacterium]